jgi:hypothetical protein
MGELFSLILPGSHLTVVRMKSRICIAMRRCAKANLSKPKAFSFPRALPFELQRQFTDVRTPFSMKAENATGSGLPSNQMYVFPSTLFGLPSRK